MARRLMRSHEARLAARASLYISRGAITRGGGGLSPPECAAMLARPGWAGSRLARAWGQLAGCCCWLWSLAEGERASASYKPPTTTTTWDVCWWAQVRVRGWTRGLIFLVHSNIGFSVNGVFANKFAFDLQMRNGCWPFFFAFFLIKNIRQREYKKIYVKNLLATVRKTFFRVNKCWIENRKKVIWLGKLFLDYETSIRAIENIHIVFINIFVAFTV